MGYFVNYFSLFFFSLLLNALGFIVRIYIVTHYTFSDLRLELTISNTQEIEIKLQEYNLAVSCV